MKTLKSRILTIRASDSEAEKIKENASRCNQSGSRYILERALSNDGFSLSQKQQIYYHLRKIKDAANYPKDNKIQILEECDTIWQLLNS